MSISEETLWDYRRVALPALCHPLARWESFPSGTFPWALQSRAAVLIIFSFGWPNTNQLSHASASCRHNAAERELGLSADTKRRFLVLMPHLPQRICLIQDRATICRVKIRTIVSPKQLFLLVSFHPQPTPILLKSLPNGCWPPGRAFACPLLIHSTCYFLPLWRSRHWQYLPSWQRCAGLRAPS